MTTKYFGKDVHIQLTCDVGGSRDQDLDKVQGSGAQVTSSNTQNTAFQEKLNFDIDVSGDNPSTGNHDISLDVVSVTTDAEYRFRAQAVDDAGCTISANSAFSAVFTTAGIKTLNATSLTWNVGPDDRLRISVEVRKTGGHGNQSITVNVNDADTFILAPWAAVAAARRAMIISG